MGLAVVSMLRNTCFLTNESPEDYADEIKMEFRFYQSEQLGISETVSVDIELYLTAISEIKSPTGEFKFQKLEQLVSVCLCISHGNAGVERDFSHNKKLLEVERS